MLLLGFVLLGLGHRVDIVIVMCRQARGPVMKAVTRHVAARRGRTMANPFAARLIGAASGGSLETELLSMSVRQRPVRMRMVMGRGGRVSRMMER